MKLKGEINPQLQTQNSSHVDRMNSKKASKDREYNITNNQVDLTFIEV